METTINPSINRVYETSWDESLQQPTDRVPFVTYHPSLSSLRTIIQQNHKILETSDWNKKKYQYLSTHFNFPNHSIHDMEVVIIKQMTPTMQKTENCWIHNIQTCYPTEVIITFIIYFIFVLCIHYIFTIYSLKWTDDIIYNNLQNQRWINCTLAKLSLLQIPYYNMYTICC